VSELLLILKYGGVLTHAGRSQAEDLGKMFRMIMYPRWADGCAVVCRERSCFVLACKDRCSHELVCCGALCHSAGHSCRWNMMLRFECCTCCHCCLLSLHPNIPRWACGGAASTGGYAVLHQH
jgi:hypothetical protein